MKQVSVLLLSLCIVSLAACGRGAAPAPEPGAGPLDPRLLVELRRELLRQLSARGITLDAQGRPQRDGKAVSAIPPRVYQTPGWLFNPGTGETGLAWLYESNGDYDHNGEVNISDITPIGQFFQAVSSDANWNLAQAADGDGNGEVNISDITPIGANFGVRTDGYVIETREAAGEWREYGHLPFSAGFPNGATLEFSYLVPSGAYEVDYRVAPVGGTRDFIWDTYVLTDPSLNADSPRLAVADGIPVLAFVDQPGGFSYGLGFAVATAIRPLNALQWNIESDLGVSNAGDMPPSLTTNQGKPLLSYCEFDGTSYNIGVKLRDAGTAPSSTWSTHLVSAGTGVSRSTELTLREGRPQLMFNDLGLNLLAGQTAFPAAVAEWTWIFANPSLGLFDHADALCSGPLVFACGNSSQAGAALCFSRSTNPAPSGPLDFNEFELLPLGSSDGWPSLAVVGGIPCIAASDYTHESLMFQLANGRTPSSSGDWFSSVVASGGSQFRNPSLAVLEGRPAIAAGATALDFYWTGGQFPDSTVDWHAQRIANETAPGGVSLVVTDGLPLIAYCVNTAGPSSIFIAIAREQ